MPGNESMRAYVAGRIRELRTAHGKTRLSQEQLAARVKVGTNTISRWETGTYEPTLNDLENLSQALNVSILDFFPRREQSDAKNQKVVALLRAANKLDESDVDELRRWAEFRTARHAYKSKKKARPPSD
jgi:transcriptional regulator with XRE-family HTH domain